MKPPTNADNWRAVAGNVAQALSFAADLLDEAGRSEDASVFRETYERQCTAHGVGK